MQQMSTRKRRDGCIEELVSYADDNFDEDAKMLKFILLQRVWISPMVAQKDFRGQFKVACKGLLTHHSLKDKGLQPVLRNALKRFF